VHSYESTPPSNLLSNATPRIRARTHKWSSRVRFRANRTLNLHRRSVASSQVRSAPRRAGGQVYHRRASRARRKPSCLISCSHISPEGRVSALVGRQGAMKPAEANATWQKTWMRCGKSGSNGAFRAIGGSLVSLRTRRAPVGLIRVFKRNAAGTFAIAVFHAQRQRCAVGERPVWQARAPARCLSINLWRRGSVTLLKHLEKFRAPAIAS
jgi:hypothetical protein